MMGVSCNISSEIDVFLSNECGGRSCRGDM